MSEAKHTPGPWKTFDDPKSNYGVQVNADNAVKAKKVVCRVGGPDRDANARLIAAAPDMLAALKEGAQCLEDVARDEGGWAWEEVLDGMRTAIAKATGEA